MSLSAIEAIALPVFDVVAVVYCWLRLSDLNYAWACQLFGEWSNAPRLFCLAGPLGFVLLALLSLTRVTFSIIFWGLMQLDS